VYEGGRSSGTPVESFAAVNVDHGRWAQSLDSLQPGMYTAVASQTDEAGNTAYSSRTFFKAAPKPKPPVNPPTNPPVNPPAGPPTDKPADQPADQGSPQDQGEQPAASGETQGSAPLGEDRPATSVPAQGQRPMEQRSTLSLAARSQKLRTVLRKGVKATVTCDGTCPADLRVVLPAGLAKRYGLGKKAVVIASGRASATSGRPARVTLRLTGRARRALRKARSLRLQVKATSPGAAPVSRTVTVR
jgi:hypothetical protein